MRVLWVMLFSITLLFSEGMHQKLIVSTDKNRQSAQESLQKLKIYFIENPNIRALNQANDLKLELETLGAYTMVVVKPIMSLSVKNRLLIELAPVFPDIFALETNGPHVKEKGHAESFASTKKTIDQEERVKTFMNTIGLQWIFLLILAAAGLLLSILRRKKLLMIDKKQKELDSDQREIENEIKNLGKHDA